MWWVAFTPLLGWVIGMSAWLAYPRFGPVPQFVRNAIRLLDQRTGWARPQYTYHSVAHTTGLEMNTFGDLTVMGEAMELNWPAREAVKRAVKRYEAWEKSERLGKAMREFGDRAEAYVDKVVSIRR